jgi:hypothetical protein
MRRTKIRTATTIFLVLAAILALIGVENIASALSRMSLQLVLDQAYDPGTAGLSQSIPGMSPMGQEFTPSISTLAQVDVDIVEAGGASGSIIMNVREGTIDGQVIATGSEGIAAGFSGWVIFDIPDVGVIPGEVYVIELQAETPTPFSPMWPSNEFPWVNDPYPGGVAITSGQPSPNNDYHFRTWGPDECTITISGQVIDVCTLLPISGASISIGGVVYATTDSMGFYSFEYTKSTYAEDIILVASATGYSDETVTLWDVVCDDQVVNFELWPIGFTPTPTNTPKGTPTSTPTPTPTSTPAATPTSTPTPTPTPTLPPAFAFMKMWFMTPDGEPYPFDVIISDGTWRKEWKNVTYIETEVPIDFTLTIWSIPNGIPNYKCEFHFSEGEERHFEFYAANLEDVEPRTTPYILFQEKGANASLTWNWDPGTLTLDWNLTCNPGKYVGVGIGIDDNISEPPNYGVPHYGEPEFVTVFPIHFPPGECVISSHHLVVATSSQSYEIVFEEIDPALGTITIGKALCKNAIIPVDFTLRDLEGTVYPQQYLIPQYAVPPGNYILVPYTDAMIALWSIVNGIPCKATPGKGLLFDIFPPEKADLMPYTSSIIAENPFAHSSFSDLAHDEETNTLSAEVSTETDYDWWGSFVLPDSHQVKSIFAGDYPGARNASSEPIYYTVNPVEGYNIVVVRIEPTIEQLSLTYEYRTYLPLIMKNYPP